LSEVAAILAEKAFDYLDEPIRRIGCKDVPIPFGKEMEDYVLPQVDDILNAVRKMF
jgi:pyruvate/2-oxoglutarate/acetoin dehydrogenase E1 component